MKARVYNARFWTTASDAAFLRATIDAALRASNFGILEFVEHAFEPYGYTALWLLAESHCAIHTFPESGQAYIELTSCNRDKAEAFREQLNTRLWPQLEEYREDETENRTRPCQS